MSQRLLDALNWTPNAIRREQATRRSKTHSGLYTDCGFCGVDNGEAIVSGPIVGICRKCAVIASGMYIIEGRDRLSMERDYKAIWHAAISTYGQDL